MTRDWKKVFNDCFGPEVLFSDTVTTTIILWYHIFGKNEAENTESIILYSHGLGLNIMSICLYAMYRSLSGGMEKAILWVCTIEISLLAIFPFSLEFMFT